MLDDPMTTERDEEFYRKAKPFVVESNLPALKALFARTTADGRRDNPDEQAAVIRIMRATLRDVLLDSTRDVHRDFFADI